MSDAKFLLDTNIIVYSFDKRFPEKRAIAERLIERALSGEGCISTQVMQEALSLLVSKFESVMKIPDIRDFTKNTLEPMLDEVPAVPLFYEALSIRERWKFAFYDAMIVAGALELGCNTLYSEDFKHGQRIENLTIINPFI